AISVLTLLDCFCRRLKMSVATLIIFTYLAVDDSQTLCHRHVGPLGEASFWLRASTGLPSSLPFRSRQFQLLLKGIFSKSAHVFPKLNQLFAGHLTQFIPQLL